VAAPEHPAITYSSYLHLDELLACQEPLSDGPEHDELLFIVIHQVYELWFKVLLHEFERLQDRLEIGDRGSSLMTMKRILTILKTIVAQIDVLETMTPLGFSSFRGRLERASGFQSAQFRELEAVLGGRDHSVLCHHPAGPDRDRIQAAMSRRSLWDSFLLHLDRLGHPIPEDVLGRDPSHPLEPSPAVQDVLVEVYRSDSASAQVCERMVDIDEGVQEWRYRHVKMVERTIGGKTGTGGSSGVDYLARTIGRQAFPDLWTIRNRL
jgi:tryptophan 2,3-dioxygenase